MGCLLTLHCIPGTTPNNVAIAGHQLHARKRLRSIAKAIGKWCDFNGPCADGGRITAYRSPGGPGIRLDGAMSAGNIVLPFYDSLLVKVQAGTRSCKSVLVCSSHMLLPPGLGAMHMAPC